MHTQFQAVCFRTQKGSNIQCDGEGVVKGRTYIMCKVTMCNVATRQEVDMIAVAGIFDGRWNVYNYYPQEIKQLLRIKPQKIYTSTKTHV